jgi:hypothetical protein
MPIIFKSKLSSSVANQTFLDKTIDDIKKGKLGLYKTTIGEPTSITDLQVYLSEISSVVGIDGEGDPSATIYSSTEIISDGDDRKVAIGKLDAALNNLQIQVDDGTIRLKQYISDSAYESANGTPIGGEVYYNTTSGKARYYDAVESNWKIIGDQVVGIQENLGTGNGSNTDFLTTNLPLNTEALNVFINGLIVDKSDYTYSGGIISFAIAPSLGSVIYVSYLSNGTPASPIISAGTNNVIYLNITNSDITNKYAALPSIPVEPTKILGDIVGGGTLEYGDDFNIVGQNFNWNGFTLDGLLSAGDIIRVQYFT